MSFVDIARQVLILAVIGYALYIASSIPRCASLLEALIEINNEDNRQHKKILLTVDALHKLLADSKERDGNVALDTLYLQMEAVHQQLCLIERHIQAEAESNDHRFDFFRNAYKEWYERSRQRV